MEVILSFIGIQYAITTIVFFKYYNLCLKTYNALKTGKYVLEENFEGTRYYRHHLSQERWFDSLDQREKYIIIFEDGAIRLLNGHGCYLHGGVLSYILHPILAYWRIKFNSLLKQLPKS